ncbi:uncharacterized protein RHOBADRAFT_64468 [Rhodotorula graminis WP1]|uniref:Uncharacterized protein n=1 Tax=Rhodotorula graminis (strain WP1) TaxID=578459 RepID=A0A194S9P4_RHOGW|nr:uncharacterized protein RHOBADRAFT_64468 [Rhodotorula graminis WP1]KPV77309.1 hypothetical protein RHOBADRAFT_64468 [Rhodotorula graminis WP1]
MTTNAPDPSPPTSTLTTSTSLTDTPSIPSSRVPVPLVLPSCTDTFVSLSLYP